MWQDLGELCITVTVALNVINVTYFQIVEDIIDLIADFSFWVNMSGQIRIIYTSTLKMIQQMLHFSKGLILFVLIQLMLSVKQY